MKQKVIKVILEKTNEIYSWQLMTLEEFQNEVIKLYNVPIEKFKVLSQDKKIEIRNTEELQWYGQSGGILITETKPYVQRVISPIPHLNLSRIQNEKQYSIIKRSKEVREKLNKTIKLVKESSLTTMTMRSISPKEHWKSLREKTQIVYEQTQQFNSKSEELQNQSEKLLQEMLKIQNENVLYTKKNEDTEKSINQMHMLIKLQKKQINQIRNRYPALDLDNYVKTVKYENGLKNDLIFKLMEFQNVLIQNEKSECFQDTINIKECLLFLQKKTQELKRA